MLHHLAGATMQVANLVNYNYHQLEDDNSNLFKTLLNQSLRQL